MQSKYTYPLQPQGLDLSLSLRPMKNSSPRNFQQFWSGLESSIFAG